MGRNAHRWQVGGSFAGKIWYRQLRGKSRWHRPAKQYDKAQRRFDAVSAVGQERRWPGVGALIGPPCHGETPKVQATRAGAKGTTEQNIVRIVRTGMGRR